MHVYVCICTCVCVSVYECALVCVCVYVCLYVCMCICMQVLSMLRYWTNKWKGEPWFNDADAQCSYWDGQEHLTQSPETWLLISHLSQSWDRLCDTPSSHSQIFLHNSNTEFSLRRYRSDVTEETLWSRALTQRQPVWSSAFTVLKGWKSSLPS